MSSDMWVKSGFDWSTYHHRLFHHAAREGERDCSGVAAMLKIKGNTRLQTQVGWCWRPTLSEWTHKEKRWCSSRWLRWSRFHFPDWKKLFNSIWCKCSILVTESLCYHLRKIFLIWIEIQKLVGKLNVWSGSSNCIFLFLQTDGICKILIIVWPFNFKTRLKQQYIQKLHLERAVKVTISPLLWSFGPHSGP